MVVGPHSSSQEFVRALKAPSDPPVEDGPTKIEIAEEAWSNEVFYVPSKGEVIVEWILTKLLKEKDKQNVLLNPIFDLRYWRLLHLICGQSSTARGTDHRHLKTWLTPLLHRIPLGPVIVVFFTFFRTFQDTQVQTLAREFTSCIFVLWPIAVQKMNTEVLQECFGSLLKPVTSYEGLRKVGLVITASYRNSLANSSIKKKLYQTFLQNHFHAWLQAHPKFTISSDPTNDPSHAFLSAGIDTLLNLDVLRQTYDSKPLDNLLIRQLQSIADVDRTLVHGFLPILFAQYVRALSKHRSSLFGSQTSSLGHGGVLDQLRQSSMNFFATMLTLVKDDRQYSAWEMRLALLKTVNEENIFTAKHDPSNAVMQNALESVLEALSEYGPKEEDSQRTTELAIQCLSIITRIDQDLISPVLSKILTRLLQIPTSTDPYFEFLDLLLDHHTKTRTMQVLIESLFEASSSSMRHDAREQYRVSFASAVMHDVFLEKLAQAVHNFMTENQCVAVMKRTFEAFKKGWEQAYLGSETKEEEEKAERKRKRRRKSTDMDVDLDDTQGQEATSTSSPNDKSSITFALIARLSSVILSSLPMHALSPSTLEQVQRSLVDFRSEVLQHGISKCLKARKRSSGGGFHEREWGIEVMFSALLRILYAMNVSRNLSMTVEVAEKNHNKLVKLVVVSQRSEGEGDDLLLSELTLEVFRTLFFDLSSGNGVSVSNCEEIIDCLLAFLQKNFPLENSALTVLSMVVDRWLPEIDSLASSEQIKRFLKLIISIKFSFFLSEPLKDGVKPEQLFLHVLHSAQFWEFRRIRDVFLDLLKENLCTTTLIEIPSLFRFLLLFPMEYFTWPILSQLIRSALSASSSFLMMNNNNMSSSSSSGDRLEKSCIEGIIILRVFLKRAYRYSTLSGSDMGLDQAELLLGLLIEPPMMDDDDREGFENATLDLAEVYLIRLLKSSRKDGSEALLNVFGAFERESFGKTRSLSTACFIQLVDLLTKDFPMNGVHGDIVEALKRIHGVLSTRLSSDMALSSYVKLCQEDNNTETWRRYVDVAKLWYALLCLRKWFDNGEGPGSIIGSGQQMVFVGDKIIPIIMPLVVARGWRTIELAKVCTTAFAILLEEVRYRPEGKERLGCLEVVIAMYVFLSTNDNMVSSGLKEVDGTLGRASKTMPVPEYVHVMSFVADSLSDVEHHTPSDCISSLVRLALLLLCDHPLHSFGYVQKFMSRCLGIFTDHSKVFVNGVPKLRLQVLELVARYCVDQQAALRAQDTSMVFLLVSIFLAPSEEHDNETQFEIFHRIISILNSLIRLRRDLVSLALPHLGLILRRLLLCVRGCRPNLGAKQMALVVNTQPRWICSTRPLGGEEAKALGRLLESLSIKTTVRIHTTQSQQEPTKAESLARPFSKHAAYVLKAYIEVMSDPLCVMSLEVRDEVKEGLFALCGMMNVHSRDALMIGGGLDAGGKAVLKAVWKEWEAVRYVGKG